MIKEIIKKVFLGKTEGFKIQDPFTGEWRSTYDDQYDYKVIDKLSELKFGDIFIYDGKEYGYINFVEYKSTFLVYDFDKDSTALLILKNMENNKFEIATND